MRSFRVVLGREATGFFRRQSNGFWRPEKLRALALCALFVIVAGCSDRSVGVDAVGPPMPSEGGGRIEGRVQDEELRPLEGAEVALFGAPTSTLTDATGEFVIENVAIGVQRVVARRLGFEDAIVKVDVVAGLSSRLQITLDAVPIVEPFHVAHSQRGSVGCGIAYRPTAAGISGAAVCGGLALLTNQSTIDQFQLKWELGGPYDRWAGSVLEMQWSSNQFDRGLWVRLETDGCPGDAHALWADARGKSPIAAVHGEDSLRGAKARNAQSECPDAANCAPSGCRLSSRVFADAQTLGTDSPVDVGVAVQQTFTQHWSQFFNQEAPAGYTAVVPQ
jgi:hypothetical protein